MHFSFNGQFRFQKDGITIGSPLEPIIADIFIIELEKKFNTNAIPLYDKLGLLALLSTLKQMLLNIFYLY